MAGPLDKAQATIMVDATRKELLDAILDAQAKGVSEHELMQLLHMNHAAMIRFITEGRE